MNPNFRSYYKSLEGWSQSTLGKRLISFLKYGITIAIVVVLTRQILEIGFSEIITNLPTQPLFYVFFLLIYFTLPVTEYFTYNISWKLGFWESQSIFLKKRIYNKTVIGYSGEVQLFFWLERKLNIPKKEAFEVVRDNNTLSSLASAFVAFSLLFLFFITSQLVIFEWIDVQLSIYLAIIVVTLLILMVIFRRFRKMLFSMSANHAIKIFSLHSGRMVLLSIFQILQWYVVMPEVGLSIWFTLVAIQLILSRLPFLPNKDLLFIGASLEFTQHADIASAGLAGLLLVNYVPL